MREASLRWGISVEDWLDLSTGINPDGWPVLPLPDDIWRRLPESGARLHRAARDYYGTDLLLAVAGSQAAIQYLPRLRPVSRVTILSPTYAEHTWRWRAEGHRVNHYPLVRAVASPERALDDTDVVILARPNNPTGEIVPRDVIFYWLERLRAKNGWLVIDEAFVDTVPEESVVPWVREPGLVVLRSLGKFFGLAGIRLGFVMGEKALLNQLQIQLGPWSVSGPAQWIGHAALSDLSWQQQQRDLLGDAAQRLKGLLSQWGYVARGSSDLYQWIATQSASVFKEQFAQRGILLRCFDNPAGIRIGLPGSESQWLRLEKALEVINPNLTQCRGQIA